jgi:diacylglycerol O-acyltransferase
MNIPGAAVTGLSYYKEAPSVDEIADAFEKNLWSRYRFRSITMDTAFVEQEGPMNRDYHFSERTLRNEKEIEDYCFAQATDPLDVRFPLWKCEVLRAEEGRSVVMFKVHHCIADGLGLMCAFRPMVSCNGDDIMKHVPLPAGILGEAGRRSTGSKPVEAKPDRLGFVAKACGFVSGFVETSLPRADSELKMNPKLADRQKELKFSGRHKFCKMPVLPCKLVKAVKQRYGCSFNEALMGALAGAIRRYSIYKLKEPLLDGPKDNVDCKCFMLMAMPRPISEKDPDLALTNKIVTPIISLPIGEKTAKARMDALINTTSKLRNPGYVAGIVAATKGATSLLPEGLKRSAVGKVISNLTANVTNVPLPEAQMTFLGKGVEEVHFMFMNNVPQVSMLSYNGNVHWSVTSDPKLMPEPELVGQFMLEELETLRGTLPPEKVENMDEPTSFTME